MSGSRLLPALPIIVALAVYANSIPGDFVFDDVVLIEQGETLRQFDLHRIFLENYWGSERADRNYRPVLLLTYAVNSRLGEGPCSFHVVNGLLNAAVAFLAFLVFRELLGQPRLASLGACLFAVLPIHTEAVANIVGRAELLAALAILGAWLLSLKAHGDSSGRNESTVFACLVGAVTFLGLCCKENTVVVPAVILVTCWVLRRKIPWRSLCASVIAVVLYLGVRAIVLTGKKSVIALIDNPLYHVDPLTRFLNGIRLLGLYAWRTIVPIHLSTDHSYDQLPVLGLAEPVLWLSVAGVIGTCAVLILLFRNRSPAVALGVLFFLVALAPTSNVIIPIGTIFAERLTFTPSLGYPLLLCGLILAIPSSRRLHIAGVVFGSLVLVYGARTWVRNNDWATASTMYLRMSRDAPRSTRSHQKSAEALIEEWLATPAGQRKQELRKKAHASIARALEIFPENGMAETSLGQMLMMEGNYAEALKQFYKAGQTLTRHKAFKPKIYLLLGQCYSQLGDYPQAISAFSKYLSVLESLSAPPDPRGYRDRGMAFLRSNKAREALNDFTDGLRLRQDMYGLWNGRGLALAFTGRMQEALDAFTGALRLNQDVPDLWNNRAMCHLSLGNTPEAIADWREALKVAGNRSPDATEVSPARLHQKIADAFEKIAEAREAEGDTDGAKKARAEAARHRQKAADGG